jgi:hypothetical protein
MRKKIFSEIQTKADRRKIKNRPRMRIHGQALKKPPLYAGAKTIKTLKD